MKTDDHLPGSQPGHKEYSTTTVPSVIATIRTALIPKRILLPSTDHWRKQAITRFDRWSLSVKAIYRHDGHLHLRQQYARRPRSVESLSSLEHGSRREIAPPR